MTEKEMLNKWLDDNHEHFTIFYMSKEGEVDEADYSLEQPCTLDDLYRYISNRGYFILSDGFLIPAYKIVAIAINEEPPSCEDVKIG